MADDLVIESQLTPGLTRLFGRFSGHAYDRHRHESYAVGVTQSGAQAFGYRGSTQVSRSGDVMVIHPDEDHDGHAADDAGFSYRMLYIDPTLIAAATGRRAALPFVAEVVAVDPVLAGLVHEAFDLQATSADALDVDALVMRLADAVARRSDDRRARRRAKLPYHQIARARTLLDEAGSREVSSTALELATGLDRYSLARAFRSLVGTSPHRYLTGRRLEDARRRLRADESIADIAAATGFADQSHLTRAFKDRYGLTPAAYRRLCRHATEAVPGSCVNPVPLR